MRVYIGGTFDCPHAGHVRLFQRAALIGDVWVSLNTDEFAARYKRKPIMSLEERMAVVREFRSVKFVIVNEGGEDSKPAILKAKPNLILHGDDWMGDDYLRQLGVTKEWLREHDIGLCYLPYTTGVSTSELLERASQ